MNRRWQVLVFLTDVDAKAHVDIATVSKGSGFLELLLLLPLLLAQVDRLFQAETTVDIALGRRLVLAADVKVVVDEVVELFVLPLLQLLLPLFAHI